MVTVEKQTTKSDIKRLITHTKVLPILLAIFHFANCILAYFELNDIALNYVAGISILPIIYLYHASFAFKLCAYYRMFLHYCIFINLYNVYDYYIGIPVSDIQYLHIIIATTILTLLIIIYLKFFYKK